MTKWAATKTNSKANPSSWWEAVQGISLYLSFPPLCPTPLVVLNPNNTSLRPFIESATVQPQPYWTSERTSPSSRPHKPTSTQRLPSSTRRTSKAWCPTCATRPRTRKHCSRWRPSTTWCFLPSTTSSAGSWSSRTSTTRSTCLELSSGVRLLRGKVSQIQSVGVCVCM